LILTEAEDWAIRDGSGMGDCSVLQCATHATAGGDCDDFHRGREECAADFAAGNERAVESTVDKGDG